MAVLFAIDGLAALVAFFFLNRALSDDFLNDQILRAVAALVWSPLLLRTQINTLLPAGQFHDILKLGPAVRSFIDERIDVGSAAYRSNWLDRELLPSLPSNAAEWIGKQAVHFFENRSSVSDAEKEKFRADVSTFIADFESGEPERVHAICQLLIHAGGLGVLKRIAKHGLEKIEDSTSPE